MNAVNFIIENQTKPAFHGPEMDLKAQLVADIISLGVKAHHCTERCVFVEFRGHIDHLFISVRENKDDKYQNELVSSAIRLQPYSFYSDKRKAWYEQSIIEKLKYTKRYLKKFERNAE